MKPDGVGVEFDSKHGRNRVKTGLAIEIRPAYARPSFSRHAVRQRRAANASRLAAAAKTNRFMSVRIRLKRIGAKNTPAFRIVVADSRSPRDGKCIEELGTYLPLKKGDNYTLNLERANYWVSKGAQPSDTVASFIQKARKTATAA
jgi:small subunit ribosomal protein S16